MRKLNARFLVWDVIKIIFCLPLLWRFKMLKQWVADPSLSSITVEERYHTFVENLRTDRYVTVTFSNMFFLRSGLMFMLTKRVPEQLVYRLDALKTCIIHWPPLAQVTLFQLEKSMGRAVMPKLSSRNSAVDPWQNLALPNQNISFTCMCN